MVQAESFTTGGHFLESPADLKPKGDEMFCAGLNRMVFHQSTHQPQLDFKPGYQYAAGTHIDRNLTWWEQGRAFFQYIGRCQSLLQAGRFHADACYFYGEGASTFVPAKEFLKPPLPPGLNFDAVNADVLLHRLRVQDGRLVLPDGMSYRLLVLPHNRQMSPPVLRRIRELIEAGATVLGDRPLHAPGLTAYPRCDEELKSLADGLWGTGIEPEGQRNIGKGRVYWGRVLAPYNVLHFDDGIEQDCQLSLADGTPAERVIDFIHRTAGDAQVYFLASRSGRAEMLDATFRVAGKQPELWDPVTGEIRDAAAFRQANGRTTLPLELPPGGSLFVVFRKPIPADRSGTAQRNFPLLQKVQEIGGPWAVRFDPKWGGPPSVVFDKLDDWTRRPEEGIRYYSGKATYEKQFDLNSAAAGRPSKIFLDLGAVKSLAQVRLNGKDLGVVWTAPWRVERHGALRPAGNRLEIDVVNLWPNRIIGDAALSPEQRYTKTNVSYPKDQPLLSSGLIGPVTLQWPPRSGRD